jgi:hypothetical protein
MMHTPRTKKATEKACALRVGHERLGCRRWSWEIYPKDMAFFLSSKELLEHQWKIMINHME